METGSLHGWQKAVGDRIVEGDVLVQIETDKATMDFETPDEGYLAKILIPAGEKNIPIGTVRYHPSIHIDYVEFILYVIIYYYI